ncbi:dihydrofolate reductase family protein [Patulibacter sp. S7RM1-6]
MSAPTFRSFGGGEELPAAAVLDAIGADAAPAVADRPRTIGVMVASVDGHAAVGGRSGALGGPEDRAIFRGLRERADALLVGPGTLNRERYSTTLDPPQRAAREAAGLPPEPLLATLSRGFTLDEDVPLLHEPLTRALIYTEADPTYAVEEDHVEVVRLPRATGAAALADLAGRGVRTVNCEGGPSLLAALVREDVLDELLLTVSPRLAGGDDALTILRGALGPDDGTRLRELALRGVWRSGDVLFLHYHLAPGGSA